MGLEYFDVFTIGHFVFGVLATAAICPEYPMIGMLTGNIIHAYMESTELDYRRGVQVESWKNHLTDLIAFFLGSIVGIFFAPYMLVHPVLRWTTVGIMMIAMIQEWGREKWPESWPFDSANHPFGWFGSVKQLVNKS